MTFKHLGAPACINNSGNFIGVSDLASEGLEDEVLPQAMAKETSTVVSMLEIKRA